MTQFHIPRNLIIDTITVPEFADKKKLWKVFDAVIEKHPYQGNEHEFFHWLREYLVDSNVKVWEGPQYTFFYREDENFYQDYVKSAKEHNAPVASKDSFYRQYLHHRHEQTVNSKEG